MKQTILVFTFLFLTVQLMAATAERSNFIVELAKGNKQALAKYQGSK